MLETILVILLIWFIISIPVSLIVGAFLSASNRERNVPEEHSQLETTRHIAHNTGKSVVKPSTD